MPLWKEPHFFPSLGRERGALKLGSGCGLPDLVLGSPSRTQPHMGQARNALPRQDNKGRSCPDAPDPAPIVAITTYFSASGPWFLLLLLTVFMGLPGSSVVRNPSANAGDASSIPVSPARCPGEGNGYPTPVFVPGKSHGWRSLLGYSPWAREDPDMTECLNTAHPAYGQHLGLPNALANFVTSFYETPGFPIMASFLNTLLPVIKPCPLSSFGPYPVY